MVVLQSKGLSLGRGLAAYGYVMIPEPPRVQSWEAPTQIAVPPSFEWRKFGPRQQIRMRNNEDSVSVCVGTPAVLVLATFLIRSCMRSCVISS